ncbi:unnamed protein product [Gadus morhua 'NCC']
MLLSELMEDFGIIIEDKRTDSVTLNKKEETWVMLAERFNGSSCIKETRDKSQLKTCWKNLRQTQKRMRQKRGGG